MKHVKDKGAIEGAAEFVQKLRDMVCTVLKMY